MPQCIIVPISNCYESNDKTFGTYQEVLDKMKKTNSDMKEQLESWQLNDGFRVEHFTVELPCNWKVVIDNFQEGYHIRTLHPQLMETVNENKESVQYDLYDGGHSRMILLGCDPSPNFKPQNTLPDSITHMLTKWDIDPEVYKDRHGEIRPALQKSKRDMSAERGKDFSHLSDAQLTDNFLYDLFPSCALSVYPEATIDYWTDLCLDRSYEESLVLAY